jgi:hypothetical protein
LPSKLDASRLFLLKVSRILSGFGINKESPFAHHRHIKNQPQSWHISLLLLHYFPSRIHIAALVRSGGLIFAVEKIDFLDSPSVGKVVYVLRLGRDFAVP